MLTGLRRQTKASCLLLSIWRGGVPKRLRRDLNVLQKANVLRMVGELKLGFFLNNLVLNLNLQIHQWVQKVERHNILLWGSITVILR